MTFQYIRKRDISETWEQLLLAADSDFVSFLLLSYVGIIGSTSLWMAGHSVEKYLKSLIIKNEPQFEPRDLSHDVNKLWEKAAPYFPKELGLQAPEYTVFMRELNQGASIKVRYSYGIDLNEPGFTTHYVAVSCALRWAILGGKAFHARGSFGLCEASFGGSSIWASQSKFTPKDIACSLVDSLLLPRGRVFA